MAADCSALEIVNLTKSFGKFTAVNNLNMEIGRGTFMGLLGPNGAGKSTTLKCITGMLKPTSGQITINGYDTVRNHRESLADVGCVIETPEHYGEFTPAEVLDYIGRYYGLPKSEIKVRATDVLEEVRLWDWRHKRIGTFSKGMKQRVSLAQALLSNPSLILLDEPTSGLDPRGMIEMREVLNNLKNGERSLLISTHILKEVSEMCDHVTMINHGTTMISGSVESLLRNSGDGGRKVTLEIRTLRPFEDGFISDLRDVDGVVKSSVVNDRYVSVEFEGTEEQQAQIAEMIVSRRMGIVAFNEKGADLEDLYMDLTRNEEVNIK